MYFKKPRRDIKLHWVYQITQPRQTFPKSSCILFEPEKRCFCKSKTYFRLLVPIFYQTLCHLFTRLDICVHLVSVKVRISSAVVKRLILCFSWTCYKLAYAYPSETMQCFVHCALYESFFTMRSHGSCSFMVENKVW